MSILKSTINYIAAAFRRQDEKRAHASASRKSYFDLQMRAAKLAIEGKSLSDADGGKLLAAAEQIGISPEQIQADRQLLDQHLPERAIADRIPALEKLHAAAKERRREFSVEAIHHKMIEFHRARLGEREKVRARHRDAKARLEAAIAGGSESGVIDDLTTKAEQARAARVTFDEETPRLEKEQRTALSGQYDLAHTECQSLLANLLAARHTAAAAENRELEHWELFGRPSPATVKAERERDSRKRHLVYGTMPPADEAASRYRFVTIESLFSPMHNLSVAALEFVQAPGQSDEEFAYLTDIGARYAFRQENGQGRAPCVYLLSREGKHSPLSPTAKDMCRLIEDVEAGPPDPSQFIVIRWANQSEGQVQGLLKRWQAAYVKRISRDAESERRRRPVMAPSLSTASYR